MVHIPSMYCSGTLHSYHLPDYPASRLQHVETCDALYQGEIVPCGGPDVPADHVAHHPRLMRHVFQMFQQEIGR